MKSPFALAALLAAFVACTTTTKGEGPAGSTSSGGGGTSSSGGTISNAQCQSTCISKVYQCSPQAEDPSAQCEAVCSSGAFTQQQLSCLQSASCSEFENATFEEVCPR